jgi:hypothetical protein
MLAPCCRLGVKTGGHMDAKEDKDLPPGELPTGRFSGREAFEKTVRDALASADRLGWREIIVSDATFSDWPLRERAAVESLHAWSRAGRRFVMLATRFDDVQRHFARFVAWRQTWGHIIECRLCRDADPLDFPSAIWTPGWMMQRHDTERSVFVCDTQPARRVALKQVLDEWIRNSAPGFPASTLGL